MKKYILKIVECNTGHGENEYVEFTEKDNLEDVLYIINLRLEIIHNFIKNKTNEEYYDNLISLKESISIKELNKMINNDDFIIEIAENPNDLEKHIYLQTDTLNTIYEEEISLLKVTPEQLKYIRYFFHAHKNDNYKISDVMLKCKDIELQNQCEQIGLQFCHSISSVIPTIRYIVEFNHNFSVDERMLQKNLLEKQLFSYINYDENKLTLEYS